MKCSDSRTCILHWYLSALSFLLTLQSLPHLHVALTASYSLRLDLYQFDYVSSPLITGKVVQQFDYSREDDEKEFMCAACSPSGQSFVLGSFDRYSS